jgi:protein-tyrosine-phosphatase/DNA-binding transcriptional ArsR family regulator
MVTNTGPRPGATVPAEGLTARARRFAAVGEPLRLAIVEHLALGDASPSELGALVDLPSNLLAFHLRVLQDAGIVARARSEADRRRSYARLRLDDPAVAALVAAPLADPTRRLRSRGRPARVVFVCTRNSARSQLAAAQWQRVSDVPTVSAGTHPAARVHPDAVRAARRHGLRLVGARTRHICDAGRPGDLLVAVCDNAYEDLSPAAGSVAGSVSGPMPDLHWAVPDPVPSASDEAFDAAYEDVALRVRHLADAVEAVSTFDPTA